MHPVQCAGPYIVNVVPGPDSITVSWRSVSSYSSLLQLFHVTVTPECPTGTIASPSQVFRVASNQSSLRVTSLGTTHTIMATVLSAKHFCLYRRCIYSISDSS